MMQPIFEQTVPDWIVGGGEMGKLVRSMDWSETPLGPTDSWPQSLRTTVNICLASDLPICIIWGPELVQIYNDGYRVICGGKHPRSMGQNFPECWSEAWPIIGAAHDSALAGNTAFLEDQHIFLSRHGYNEECFFTFSFSPVRSEDGKIGGLFHPVIEMTAKVLGERRTRSLRDLATLAGRAKTIEEAIALSTQTLAPYPFDLPFVLTYLIDGTKQQARLAAATGLPASSAASPRLVDLCAPGESSWPLGEVALSGLALQLNDVQQRFGPVCCSAYPEPVRVALLLPITPPGMDRPVALLVVGVSPRLALDERYKGFYDLLAAAVTTAVANARAREEEIKRAEALAALDRAKTDFFSNVSHEFRTPLTLLLGPLEEVLTMQHGVLPVGAHEQISIVHRNALRLQKLVNTLLDFSLVEANRLRATYRATDLAAVTSELASVFQSAVEKAGMRLVVDCPPLQESVYVDLDMWEKIVLNLISNAFKFTLEGAITVTLEDAAHTVKLSVRDTGAGIDAAQLPHIFERFHRVEGVPARTHEGTGIGLALVQELVRQHGGTVAVESVPGQGSSFVVTIPKGSSHLPAARLALDGTATPSALPDGRYATEVLRWLPAKESEPAPSEAPLSGSASSVARQRILLVDDNADMRAYVSRLLRERYAVETVPNGEAALAAVRSSPPDLVIADVMMPHLDGLGLLARLRADPATSSLPVIILSARAGEESRAEGIVTGADDYLIKPFNAQELLARVGAQLQLARVRREANLSLRESEARLRAFVTASSDVVYRMSPDWSEMRHLDGRDFIADAKEPRRGWIQEYIHPDDQPRVLEAIDEAIRTKSPFELEHRVRRIDGTLGWTSSHAIPLLDAEGAITEWFGAASDVTLRKEAAEALGRFAVELTDADRRKNEFLAMLAHELRNPLAPISAAAHLLKFGKVDEARVRQTSEIIDRQVRHLTSLVDDLLDVSRVSRGQIELEMVPLEMRGVVADALEQVNPLMLQRGHQLVLHLAPGAARVLGDAKRLVQVIANLLANAAKYTPEGGNIRLAMQVEHEQVVLTVQDDGIGLTADLIPHIFELFIQAERSSDRSAGGLGLGLALVRSLVELHGGKASCVSAGLGCGSVFTVTLPLLAADEVVSNAATAVCQPVDVRRSLLIMIVDDNVDAALTMAMLLEDIGHRVIVEHGSRVALERARKEQPDVCLLDIGLPEINGNQLAQQLRAQSETAAATLIAVTGYGQERDRRESLAAGFDEHMVKPLDFDRLEALLTTIVLR